MGIKERIREIAGELGGPTRLARAAGLAPSTVTQYLSDAEGRSSEPGVDALVKLARGAGVSIGWLASGQGPKNPEDVPAGYVALGFLNLAGARDHIRAILAHLDRPPDRRLFWQPDLVGRAQVSGRTIALGGSETLGFEPEVLPGDTILVDIPHGHSVAAVTLVSGWNFIETGVQLVADGAWLKLRRLRRRKDAVEVILPNGKVERVLTGAPADFIWFGLVVWRGGVIAKIKPS